MTQQLNEFGAPLAGGRLYFYQAGTVSTPQNAFQDSALTIPWPNPFILDASGYVDQLFFADGSIKIRLTDSNGVEKRVKDGLLVVGASSGGGGGSPVDATTVLATGDIKVRYGTGVLSGFVRCNARTIGSATSGASERANADTQSLWEYLWNTDANLTVSTGRGASSAADWAANKTIALPDWRGRALAALDDMGNSAAGRLTATYFGTSAIVLGAAGGAESQTLTAAQLAANIPNSAVSSTSTTPNGTYKVGTTTTGINAPGGTTAPIGNADPTFSATTSTTVTINPSGGNPHPIASPMMLATVYLKI